MTNLIQIDTISQVHEALGIEKPSHPLVSVLRIDDSIAAHDYGDATYVFGFYQVSLKSGISGNITYGRNSYDFQEGSMIFSKPGQVMSFANTETTTEARGWTLLFHPDLIRKSQLGKNIENYSFFSYEINEALHLSENERKSLTELIEKIECEYKQNIDRHTQKLVVANIELILDYCIRYYDRQFYVRTNLNQDIVSRLEQLLRSYYDSNAPLENGLPTVKYCGEQLNMSPSYLSDLLKKETGKTTQQHIQDTIIEKAKTMLLNSTVQVSEIAFDLGFEYPQHFSKLFKKNTGMSPVKYRQIG